MNPYLSRTQRPSLRQRAFSKAAEFVVKLLGAVGYDLTNIHESSWWRGISGDSWGGTTYIELARLAADNPYAGRAKWLFGQLASSLPLMVREVASGDDEQTDFPKHPILTTLRRPNERQSYQTWMLELCEHLWFGGEVLMEFPDARLTGTALTGSPAGTPGPAGINLLRPDGIQRIEYRLDDPTKPFRYHYKVLGSRAPRREILAEFVFRIVIPGNIDEPERGFPLFRWARRAAMLMAAGDKWNKSVYDGGGRAGGVLTWKPPKPGMKLGKDRLQEIVDATSQQMATARKENSLVFIPDDFALQKDTTSAREQDWLGGDVNNARKVIVAMGFDPSLFGDSANKTYCLPGETRVTTFDGPRRIDEVEEGDFVWSVDVETGQMVLRRVLWQGKVGTKQLLRIKFKGGEIRATSNHPFLVRRKHRTGLHSNSPVTYRHEFVSADNLHEGDWLVKAFQYHPPESRSPDETPIDLEMMEYLGAMLGDGFAKSYGGGRNIVSMSGIPGPVRDFYRDVAERRFTKHAAGGQRAPVAIVEKEREFRFISKRTVEFFEHMGVAGTAKTKTVPRWVFTQPRMHRIAFLRGLFDTDGSVTKQGRMSYASASEALARDVRDLAVSCGIQVSKISHVQRDTRLPNGEQVANELWNFTATVPALNKEIGSRNPVDLERLLSSDQSMKWRGRCMGRVKGNPVDPRAPENCQYARVQSVEVDSVEDVYDIEVETSHNFFAEHLCVHNSNMRSALRAALMLNVLPVMDWVFSEINARLMPRYGTPHEIYIQRGTGWIGELLQEDASERSTRLRAEIEAGIRTRVEARSALNLTGDLEPEDKELAGRLTVRAGTILLDGIATDLLTLARLLDPERKTAPVTPSGGNGETNKFEEFDSYVSGIQHSVGFRRL